jgi:hypothetical protein
VDWFKPYVTPIVSLVSVGITLLIIIGGGIRLSAYRLKERQRKVGRLAEREAEFFNRVNDEVSALMQER